MLKIFLSQKNPGKTFSRWYNFYLEVMTNIFSLHLKPYNKSRDFRLLPPISSIQCTNAFLGKNNAK